jgi:predicted nuclease of predicted toxin-antitoxin system
LKLLFDANLSPKLVRRLADLFPGLAHVIDTGLAQFTLNTVIWDYAALNGFTIVTTTPISCSLRSSAVLHLR